jgi:uncharacterized protein (DUF924 family)
MSRSGAARGEPDDPRCRELLDYWFGDADSDAGVFAARAAQWFGGGPAVDQEIRQRFAGSHAAAVGGALDGWLAQPRGRLALVILADQVSRHLFRGDARAFAHDALARRWASEGMAADVERDLRAIERVFLYLPLEHSESLADAPFAAVRARWEDPASYRATQALAQAARAAGVAIIRYRSVRDPRHRACHAVLEPKAFRQSTPLEQHTWWLKVARTQVVAETGHGSQRLAFDPAELGMPAPSRPRG